MTGPAIDRRRFLTGGALVVAGAGAALSGCTGSPRLPEAEVVGQGPAPTPAPPEPPEPPEDLRTWEGVRGQFALDPDLAHFAAFVLAAHPRAVRDAIERWRDALDADTEAVLRDSSTHDERVRSAAAGYLRVNAEELALTDSTTAGLGLVYHGLRLAGADHVLTTTHDFYSTHESLRLVAERSGAEVEKVALYDDPAAASAEEMVSRLEAAVRPSTRVVALTWVHSGTGVKLPVRDLATVLARLNADRAPEERALLCLDAIHGLGAEDATPGELGCDVYISGTHKWLFGPRGTGLVWARRGAGEAIDPIIPSFTGPSFGNWLTGGDAPSPFGLAGTPGGYKPYEHRWAVADAFELHLEIGARRIAQRTRELAAQLKDGLADVPDVRLVTPRDPDLSAGLVCCAVPGSPADLVGRLRREHGVVASVTPYRERYLRFGTSIVNTPEEVDAAVRAVADLI